MEQKILDVMPVGVEMTVQEIINATGVKHTPNEVAAFLIKMANIKKSRKRTKTRKETITVCDHNGFPELDEDGNPILEEIKWRQTVTYWIRIEED